jgi:hypothetical protein
LITDKFVADKLMLQHFNEAMNKDADFMEAMYSGVGPFVLQYMA